MGKENTNEVPANEMSCLMFWAAEREGSYPLSKGRSWKQRRGSCVSRLMRRIKFLFPSGDMEGKNYANDSDEVIVKYV